MQIIDPVGTGRANGCIKQNIGAELGIGTSIRGEFDLQRGDFAIATDAGAMRHRKRMAWPV